MSDKPLTRSHVQIKHIKVCVSSVQDLGTSKTICCAHSEAASATVVVASAPVSKTAAGAADRIECHMVVCIAGPHGMCENVSRDKGVPSSLLH